MRRKTTRLQVSYGTFAKNNPNNFGTLLILESLHPEARLPQSFSKLDVIFQASLLATFLHRHASS